MGQVIVDDILLREPNLLTPNGRPIRPVEISSQYPVIDIFLFRQYRRQLKKAYTETLVGGVTLGPRGITTVDGTATFSNSAFNLSQSNYTVVLRASITTIKQWGGVFSKTNTAATANHLILQRNNTNDIFTLYHNGTSLSIPASMLVPSDVESAGWKNLVLRYNGSIVQIWVDGIDKGSVAFTTDPATTSDKLVIFGDRSASATYCSNGTMELFTLVDEALPDARCKSLSHDPYQLLRPPM